MTNRAELLAPQVAQLLVQPLEAASVVLAAGPRIFDSQGDPLRIPKVGALDSEAGFVGEGDLIPDVSP